MQHPKLSKERSNRFDRLQLREEARWRMCHATFPQHVEARHRGRKGRIEPDWAGKYQHSSALDTNTKESRRLIGRMKHS